VSGSDIKNFRALRDVKMLCEEKHRVKFIRKIRSLSHKVLS